MDVASPVPGRIAFGGDYNPEQWPEEIWREDVALMRRAGVSLVTVGVFAWAKLEPTPGRFDFGWLDRVLDLLHEGGVSVDLATATASPPPWLAREHPEVLPVDARGATLWPGSRQAYCPSSRLFREHAARLVGALAERYHQHPALRLWHVSNEYACHVTCCYCDVSAADFRDWLRDRYGDVDTLNDAWGTSFWSQHYHDFDEVLPPRLTPAFGNPGQSLDFRRFSSDAHLECYRAERDLLRRITPDVPVTTNFMAHTDVVDCWRWAEEVDLVSNDHYLQAENPRNHVDLALNADITRGLAGGRPWLLMEHSTSAVNWQPRNVAKRPGQMLRNSLAHVARGSDSVMFFQWRQSRAGAEKYHSALVPHAGTDSRIWEEVEQFGAALTRLRPVLGSTVDAQVALLFDYDAWWVCEGPATPSRDIRYRDMLAAVHADLLRRGVAADVVRPGTDLGGYRLVVVPTLTSVSDPAAAVVADAVAAGAHVLVTYFSGIVDERDHVRLGGYPGAFRDLLGVRAEEFCPLAAGETVELVDTGTGEPAGTGSVWSEDLALVGATAVLEYAGGPVPGRPAVTRHDHGAGVAWYVATRLDQAALASLFDTVLDEADVRPPVQLPDDADVEVVVRRGGGSTYTFLLNHGGTDVELPVVGTDLLSGRRGDHITIPGGSVAVVHAGPTEAAGSR